jgi:hypothetical protein
MYCGGNQIVQVEEVVRAATLEGDILDPSGSAIPHATVQIQAHNSSQMIIDEKADYRGHFIIPRLKTGRYWLGVSSYGFNLHVWDIQIERRAKLKKLTVKLSVGT